MKLKTGDGITVHQQGGWGAISGFAADILVSQANISPGSGSGLSFFGAQQPSYQECRDRSDYSAALPWTKVPSGSYLCIEIAGNRVGQARVDYNADQSGAITDVEASGVIYQPTS